MFSFVYSGECAGHQGPTGATDIFLLKAVCDAEPVPHGVAAVEVSTTMGDIDAILHADKSAWFVSTEDEVMAISDGAAISIARSIVENGEYAYAIKHLAKGEPFGIIEFDGDCRMMMHRATHELRDALTALSHWAWEKVASGAVIACSKCGQDTKYVFAIDEIGLRPINGCGDRHKRVVAETD